MRKACFVLFGAAALTLAGCGASTNESDGVSTPSHLLLGAGHEGLLRDVHQREITICLEGTTITSEWARWTRAAMMKWIEPLRAVAPQELATSVRLVTSDAACDAADGTVALKTTPRGVAYTRTGGKPRVVVYNDDSRNGRVILHELGHAFGLADTYFGSESERQPDSVMKSARFDTPQTDDITGLRALYRRLYGRG